MAQLHFYENHNNYIGSIVKSYKELIKQLDIPIEQVTDDPTKKVKTRDILRALSNQNKQIK